MVFSPFSHFGYKNMAIAIARALFCVGFEECLFWGTNGDGVFFCHCAFFFFFLGGGVGCTTFFSLGGRCDKTTKVSYESLEDEIRGGGTSPEENARTNTAKKGKKEKKVFSS